MRKTLGVVTASLVAFSITMVGCGNKNTAMNPGNYQNSINQTQNQMKNRTNNMTNDVRNQVGNRMADGTTPGKSNMIYNDGIYLGEGNKAPDGSHQAAIVTVTGGKITDIVLKTIDKQGKEIGYSGATGKTLTNNTSDRDRSQIGNMTPGATNTGQATYGNRTMQGASSNTNMGTGVRSSIKQENTATGTDTTKRNLINTMIQRQTSEVDVGTNTAAVNDYKAAVSRALDKARKF